MSKLVKHRDNVYIVVRQSIDPSSAHVVGVYEFEEDAFDICDSYNQQYLDAGVIRKLFEVQISQYYAR